MYFLDLNLSQIEPKMFCFFFYQVLKLNLEAFLKIILTKLFKQLKENFNNLVYNF